MNSMMDSYNFQVPIQIKMSDLDPFAHVNNGTQCNYFDYGRSSYFEHVLNAPVDWRTMNMVIVHIELDFKGEIDIHDAIVCETKVTAIGNKSVKMMQQLRDTRTNVVKTTCYSVLAGFDRQTHTSAPISDFHRKLFSEFENLSND